MNRRLSQYLDSVGNVATWEQLTAQVSARVVTHAAGAGQIRRILPRVYVRKGTENDRRARLRAALLFAGPGSALSHTTALSQWPRVHLPNERVIHVAIPSDRDRRSVRFVVVHRDRKRDPRDILTRGGLPTHAPTRAVVEAWAVLDPRERRAPVFDAVRLGLTDADRLDQALRSRPKLKGRAELRELLRLIGAGCRSELEILGYRRVLSDPHLPRAELQYEVAIDGRRYVLDAAWPDLLIALELDGAAYHGNDRAREYDLRRDADLARAGWLTVRVTYERLRSNPEGIVDELTQIIAVRRRQLGPVP